MLLPWLRFRSWVVLFFLGLATACASTGAGRVGSPGADRLLEAAESNAAIVLRLGPELWTTTPHAAWLNGLRAESLKLFGFDPSPFMPETWLEGLPGWERGKSLFVALVPASTDPEAMLDDFTHRRPVSAPMLRIVVPTSDGEALSRSLAELIGKDPARLGPPDQTRIINGRSHVRIETILPLREARDSELVLAPVEPVGAPAEPTAAYRRFAREGTVFGLYARSWQVDRLLWQWQLMRANAAYPNVPAEMRNAILGMAGAELLHFLTATSTDIEIDDVALVTARLDSLQIQVIGSLSPGGESRWRQLSRKQTLPFPLQAQNSAVFAFLGLDLEHLAASCADRPNHGKDHLSDQDLLFVLPFQPLKVLRALTCQAEPERQDPWAIPPAAALVAIPDDGKGLLRLALAAQYSASASARRDARLAPFLEAQDDWKVRQDRSATELTLRAGYGVEADTLIPHERAEKAPGLIALMQARMPFLLPLLTGAGVLASPPEHWWKASHADARVRVHGSALVADLVLDAAPPEEAPVPRTWSRTWLPRDAMAVACLSAARGHVANALEAYSQASPNERARYIDQALAKAKPVLACAEKASELAAAVRHLRGLASHFENLALAPAADDSSVK